MKSDHMQEICKEIERSVKSLAASEKLYQSGLMEDALFLAEIKKYLVGMGISLQ
jgi:uncharacterized protein (UPF0332 family)